MTADVKGLLRGADQGAAAAARATHLGRRTADDPFAILLASATPQQAGRPAPAVDAAAELEAALEAALDGEPQARAVTRAQRLPAPAGALGTSAPDLEPGAASPTSSAEEEQEAPESSLLPAPAPIPAPAGTGVILPLPFELASRLAHGTPPSADPAGPGPAAADLAHGAPSTQPGRSHPSSRARSLHQQLGMPEGASDDRREHLAEGSDPMAPGSPVAPAAPRPPARPAPSVPSASAPDAAAAAADPSLAWRAATRAAAPAPESRPGAAVEAAANPAEPEHPEAAPRIARRDDRRGTLPEQPPRPGLATPPVASRIAPTADGVRAAPPPPAAAGQALIRELGTGARMAQASRAATPLREPPAAKGTKALHPAEVGPQAHLAPQGPPVAAEPVTRPATVTRAAPLVPPEPPQPLLGGTVLPHTAHLRLESESLGDLSLHLRVRDGVAHLRVEGEQAGQLAGRSQELQRALAAEGLQLGQLEVERPAVPAATPDGRARASADQGAPQGRQERAERDEAAPGSQPAAAPPRRPSGRATAHHVEA